jgi:hypothetical protein
VLTVYTPGERPGVNLGFQPPNGADWISISGSVPSAPDAEGTTPPLKRKPIAPARASPPTEPGGRRSPICWECWAASVPSPENWDQAVSNGMLRGEPGVPPSRMGITAGSGLG